MNERTMSVFVFMALVTTTTITLGTSTTMAASKIHTRNPTEEQRRRLVPYINRFRSF
jgi:hypothetical protein